MMHYGKNFTGNERFFGFCVDILELIARDVGFDYILDLVPDRKYGAKDPQTSEWNGMVAQLMKYKADLAVAPMTITHARESVIDFTKPFMNLGISILFKVPTTPPTKLFSFMNPLAFDIWLYVLAAYFLVSFTIYTVANFSPIEHSNEIKTFNTCSTNNGSKSGDFNLSNSFWFTIGTLMQQGSDLSPRAISTRIVSAIWWFFTLIIIASYTANLAAFLTVERMITPIENAEDLADQTEISYGTLDSGSTMAFFRDSLIETYRKMWRNMDHKKKPSALTSTYEEGIKRVKESNYAFLMESTMLDYIIQRDCNLTQIGGLLDTKGYGIATPKGSPWRDKISLAILELQEKGDIQMLYDKWWKSTGETCVRNRNNKISKANALGLDNIGKNRSLRKAIAKMSRYLMFTLLYFKGGVFVVLIVGILFSICVAMFEFWQHYKLRQKEMNDILSMLPVTNDEVLQHCSIALQPKASVMVSSVTQLDMSLNQIFDDRKMQIPPQQRSLWVEMFDEFYYALRCMDRRQRPALKRYCSQCHPLKHVVIQNKATTVNSMTTGTTAMTIPTNNLTKFE
ncbi:hypothetical protein DOY81_007619 [Sarcophaga bullata]|nr:hypothetical protein DOY81_007619 [Sarcophaga bullata]